MTEKGTLSVLLRDLPEHLPGGLLIYRDNPGEEILYANTRLCTMFGCSSLEEFLELSGGSFATQVYPEDRNRVEREIREQILENKSKTDFVNYRICKNDGSIRRVEEFGHRVYVDGVGPVFYVYFLDYDNKYRAYDIDSLTGLPGKNRFIQHAATVLALTVLDARAPQMAFVYANIHNFNRYNLRNGSEKGNQFLIKMAGVLQKNFPNRLISRFTDDHFMVLTTLSSLEKRLPVISREIHELYDSSHLEVKFGIYPVEDAYMPVESACGMAQLACDRIRDIPDRHISFYTKAMGEARRLRSYVIDHFQKAMDNRWIQVYFQPVIRSISGTMASVEALARWVDPKKGTISPGIFIPYLEESRQIRKLDLYVLEEICRMYQGQKEMGKTVIPTSFNLSRLDFFQGSIFEDVETIRERYQMPRNMLYVEITESAFVTEGDVLRQEIDRFREAGYEVWMDDFGSGYSSLNTLKDYTFDEIKIDMAFLSQFTEKSQDIIRAIVRMAKEIGIHTLVEGVETREQAEFARSIGCELLQGYYFGKPMALPELKHVRRKKQWEVETPQLRQYYGSLGAIDFLTDKSMAIVEFSRKHYHYLFANEEFRETLRSVGRNSLEEAESIITGRSGPIGRNLWNFMEDILHTRTGKTLTYTENGQYMKLDARHLASNGENHLFLCHLTNISINTEEEDIGNLDWATRNILYLYQNISLVDEEKDEAVPFLMNSPYRQYFFEKRKGLQAMIQEYARHLIYPEDRERFLEFNDRSTLQDRIRKNPAGTVSGFFRTLGNDGKYHWDVHSIFPVSREGKKYMLYTTRHSPMEDELEKQAAWRYYPGAKKEDC